MWVCKKCCIFVETLSTILPMNRTTIHRGLLLAVALFVILLAGCAPKSKGERELATALAELEEAIAMRDGFADLKRQRIEFHRSTLESQPLSYEQKMGVIDDLIGEYYKYQLDSTIAWMNRGISLAVEHHDRIGADALRMRIGQLYATAGFYNEAEDMLHSVDTTTMQPAQLRLYYMAAHSYFREAREYSPENHIKTMAAKKEEYYITRLIATENDVLERSKLLCTKYGNAFDWNALSGELEKIMPTLSPDEQEFAYFSYLMALSRGDDRGTPEEFMTHLARSARADMRSNTTDYASLCMLSEMLFYTGDIERAFRYIKIAMQDATFYNSRLRPWQVALMMPVIEQTYSRQMMERGQMLQLSTGIISLLVVVLLIVLWLKSRQNRQMKVAKQQLEEMNSQLGEYIAKLSEQSAIEHQLLGELSEANAVKEQYIGLFLVICSNYIDRLKSYHTNVRKRLSQGSADALRRELDKATIIEDAEKEFYENFDNAFLSLYPTFVEEFNALLRDDAQITPKNPKTLNTELRIFALIKLGITDSSRIASLLRYSVNTIYNYRAGVKNKTKFARDDFEESIRNIGGLKNTSNS